MGISARDERKIVVPVEPESTGWIAALAGTLGVSGAWLRLHTTQSAQTVRLKTLEKIADGHEKTLDTLSDITSAAEVTLSNMGDDIDEVKEGVNKIVRHITDTDLV